MVSNIYGNLSKVTHILFFVAKHFVKLDTQRVIRVHHLQQVRDRARFVRLYGEIISELYLACTMISVVPQSTDTQSLARDTP